MARKRRIDAPPAAAGGEQSLAAPPFPIVGIGASAGGLEAITAMLAVIPPDTGAAFVVVQHLSPGRVSALPEILARATAMPVSEAGHDDPVEPNHVYVIPPGRSMTMSGGRLQLAPRKLAGLHHPIDQFLRSLAAERGDLAIGVILSGDATDGTLGLEAIKAQGGITFAQDDSAQHAGMPASAVASGAVDAVMSPPDIAREVTRITGHRYAARQGVDDDDEEPDDLFEVFRLLRASSTIDFTPYKSKALQRRIARRMLLRKVDAIGDYVKVLRSTAAERHALCQDLLIGVTSFFRNPEGFEQLKTQVLRRLLAGRSAEDPLRVWVLGCSTGQEAYSVAMAVAEVVDAPSAALPLKVFASDLNAAAIERARTGLYPAAIAQDLTPDRLQRFFTEVDGQYRVVKQIRDVCVFTRHDVLGDPPFSRMDLVSCRNVPIYLEPRVQQQILPILHYALRPGGHLWLENAETIGNFGDLFETASARHGLYAKRSGGPPERVQPFSRSSPFGAATTEAARLPHRESADLLKETDRILLAKYAPPGVLVSSELDILQYRGATGPFLAPTPGRATLNLLKMLRPGLVPAVQSAVERARRDDAPVRTESISVQFDDGSFRHLAIEVIPVTRAAGGFLVLFEDAARPPRLPAPNAALRPADVDADGVIDRLTRELSSTRDYLQSVIEQQENANADLQSANEEAQSANEELQSTNEELETSKEELQSSNDELERVNEELEDRNRDLVAANTDLHNLFAAADLPVVMVGLDLRIRRFTAAAGRFLSLSESDINRSILDLRFKVPVPNLEGLLRAVIATATVREVEIQETDGHWFAVRVRPYRTLDDAVAGAVIVLVDIDSLKREGDFARSVIATVPEPMLVLDGELRVRMASPSFLEVFNLAPGEIEGQLLSALTGSGLDGPDLQRLLETIVAGGNPPDNFEIEREAAGERHTVAVHARRLVQPSSAPPLVLVALQDITARNKVEALQAALVTELTRADQNRNEFLAMLAHELRNPLAPIRAAAAILERPDAPHDAVARARLVMDRQIVSMTRLIEDLLDVARVTQGKIVLRKSRVDLVPILERSIEVMKPHADDRHQTVTVALPTEPVSVAADAARLEQVFGNLLTNASKFTPAHGRIAVGVELAGGDGEAAETVRVRISDSGIGITADTAPHLFGLFTQAGKSPHSGETGLGIGLTLVERLLTLHGGSVTVHSEGLNRGSDFIVTLPVLRGTAIATASENTDPAAENKSLRVLVVDDHADAAEITADLLRLAGHDVRVAHSGAAALETAAQFVPEAVFLDLRMREMDGYTVARRLRQIPGVETAMVIAITGFGGIADRNSAAEAGFDDYVVKPVDPELLPQLLARKPIRSDSAGGTRPDSGSGIIPAGYPRP